MDELTTVEDLDGMTPAERDDAFAAATVRDPQTLPAQYRAVLDAQDDDVRARVRRAS